MNKVRQCSSCTRMTRPPRSKLAQYPGTVLRRYGDKCSTCFYSGATVSSVDNLAYHLAGLNSFLNRRRDRELAHARADHIHKYLERVSA